MFKPISAAVGLQLGFAPIYALSYPGSAVSTEALVVSQLAGAVVHSVERSAALFGGKASAISEVWRAASEASAVDWDGNGAKAVNTSAALNAVSFIRALPAEAPLPEVSADPDGSIALDWISARNRVFTVSVGAGNRLPYAWLDGGERGHGVAVFDQISVPKRILEGVLAIMPDDPVTVRPT